MQVAFAPHYLFRSSGKVMLNYRYQNVLGDDYPASNVVAFEISNTSVSLAPSL